MHFIKVREHNELKLLTLYISFDYTIRRMPAISKLITANAINKLNKNRLLIFCFPYVYTYLISNVSSELA